MITERPHAECQDEVELKRPTEGGSGGSQTHWGRTHRTVGMRPGICATRRAAPTGDAPEAPSLMKTHANKAGLCATRRTRPTGRVPRYHPLRSAAMAVATRDPHTGRGDVTEAGRRRKRLSRHARDTPHAGAEDAYGGALGWRGETIAARPSPAVERGAPYEIGFIHIVFFRFTTLSLFPFQERKGASDCPQ